MKKFTKFNIIPQLIDSSENLATVVYSPLEQGFGTTLGNALRRVLLGSIPSPAIFALRINSVPHEFMAIDGVLEDTTNIILNIKKLVVKVDEAVFNVERLLEGETPIERWDTLKIRKNKKGIVYSADIETPPGVKVVNPNLRICELTEDLPFEMDLYLTVDRGYKNFMENKETLNTLKIIAVDSLFSPVVKVEWHVVEEKTTKHGTTDKLTLTVATNGSIKAIDAISYAAQILVSLLEPISQFNPKISEMKLLVDENVSAKKTVSAATSIDELGLTARSYNSLKTNGINTIPELISMTLPEAEKIKNLGKKSLDEIIQKLKEKKLSFKE